MSLSRLEVGGRAASAAVSCEATDERHWHGGRSGCDSPRARRVSAAGIGRRCRSCLPVGLIIPSLAPTLREVPEVEAADVGPYDCDAVGVAGRA